MSGRVRVLVVDDAQLARLGIITLLETDPTIEVVASARDGASALEACAAHAPDVVLLDLKMPGMDGVRVTEALHARGSAPRVLMVTQLEGDSTIQAALAAGASGYVGKDADGDEILRAVHEVAAGRRYLPESIRARMESGERPVTSREREVLELVAKGLPNRDVARVLAISERTVNIHLHNIFRKLGASNRAEAVAVAHERGLLLKL